MSSNDLKVIEENVKKLMEEDILLDQAIAHVAEIEKNAVNLVEKYRAMQKYANDIAPDMMPEEEWEEFFNEHFVHGAAPGSSEGPSAKAVIHFVKKAPANQDPPDIADKKKKMTERDLEMD